MHGRRKVNARDEDVRVLIRLLDVRDDEAETFCRHREASDDEVHALRRAIEVAAVLDEARFRLQRLQRGRERHEFLALEPHALGDVFGQHRPVGLFYECVDPFF